MSDRDPSGIVHGWGDTSGMANVYSLAQAFERFKAHNGGVMLDYSVHEADFHQSSTCNWK